MGCARIDRARPLPSHPRHFIRYPTYLSIVTFIMSHVARHASDDARRHLSRFIHHFSSPPVLKHARTNSIKNPPFSRFLSSVCCPATCCPPEPLPAWFPVDPGPFLLPGLFSLFSNSHVRQLSRAIVRRAKGKWSWKAGSLEANPSEEKSDNISQEGRDWETESSMLTGVPVQRFVTNICCLLKAQTTI